MPWECREDTWQSSSCVSRMSWECLDIPDTWLVVPVFLGYPGSVWTSRTSWTSWTFRTHDSSACVTRMSWKCQDMVEIPYAWEIVAVKLGCPGSVGTSRMSRHTHECLCVQRTFWNCPGTLGHPRHKDMSACVYQDSLDTRT